MKPPVLLIAFRRPDLTEQVIDALREASPTRLYVAVDGARPGDSEEARLVQRVWDVVESSVDWPCSVERRIRLANLGCRHGVVDAIDWFFTHEPEGIILEDDIIPTPEFFEFCADLLVRYRDDDRVLGISGDNCGQVQFSDETSYSFVRHPDIWGWATWRRAWSHYDRDMQDWRRVRGSGILDTIFPNEAEKQHFVKLFDRMADDGTPDTWDYQWVATCYLRGGLTALPAKSLVRNVGFRPDATHTTGATRFADIETGSVMPLIHPRLVHYDRRAELEILERVEGVDLDVVRRRTRAVRSGIQRFLGRSRR